MLPTSHPVPIQPDVVVGGATLADAFSEFSAAAGRLEHSYHQLQNEVVRLRAVLAERNRALRASEAETSQMRLTLRQIVDSLPCGVLVIDEKKLISLINPEAQRLLGISAVKPETWNDIPLLGCEQFREILNLPSQEPGELELCLDADGEKRWLAIRGSQLVSPASGPREGGESSVARVSTIVILRDATSQKHLEEEREAARNVVALAEMSAVLAHEIRNPLASLELFAGLIRESDAEAGDYVSHLQAGIRTLSATVNNVLRFHGRGPVALSPVVLNESLSRAVEFVRPLAEQRQIHVFLHSDDEPLAIAGDDDALQQTFLNIGLNALQHTAVDGWFRVALRRVALGSQPKAQIEFADNGCGIAEERLPRLFEGGYSGDGHSYGLGLAVCRRIVEQHGGTISVCSELNHGTKFFLEFPLVS